MKKTLWSLMLLIPMSALAQPLSPKLEEEFLKALNSKISRENVTLEHTVTTKTIWRGDETEYNLGSSPEAFALKLESIPGEGPRMGISIATHIKKTRAIKDDLVLELKDAVSKTSYLKKDEKAVIELLSSLDVKPIINLFEVSSTISGYRGHVVKVGVEVRGETYCEFSSNQKYSTPLFSGAMRDAIDSAITPSCIQQLKDLVTQLVADKENVLVMKDAIAEQGKLLRTALNDDNRENVKDFSTPVARRIVVQGSTAIRQ